MKTKLDAEDLNLMTLAKDYSDENKARALFESMRWPNGPTCPHCQFTEIYKLKSRGVWKGAYKCAACRKQFTARIGTVLEDSHIPYAKWMMAMFVLCSSKKSVSAHQIHRMIGVTYKTAWFLCHRIRHAMMTPSGAPKLTGTVEADETFIGGKGDQKQRFNRQTPVVALVQRDGDVRTEVISNVTHNNICPILRQHVSKEAILNTDEHKSYKTTGKEFKRHDTVVHSEHEYSRPQSDGTKAGINSAESFFSLLKRGVYGSWHHVSREHLPRYASEFEFRWNHRKTSDGERLVKAVEATEGKRLTYRQAI